MPIAKIAGFAHLASDGKTGDYAQGHSFVQSEYKVVQSRVGSATPLGYAPSNGRIAFGKQLYNGSGSAHGISTLELAPFFGGLNPSTFKKFILAFRMETRDVGLVNPTPLIGFTLNDVAATSGIGYADGDLIPYYPDSVTAKIWLVELVFDFVNKKLDYYVDNALSNSRAIPDKFISGFAGIKMFSGRKDVTLLYSTPNNQTNYICWFDNMYSIVDTGDTSDPYRDRLGAAMLVEPVTVKAVEGSWSPSTGTNLSVLTTARSTDEGTNQTPVSVSPSDNSGLTITLDTNAGGFEGGRKLLGISVSVGSYKGSSESGALDTQWTSSDGDQAKIEVPTPNLASTSVVARLQGIPSLKTIPAAAKLNSLRLKLLPR